MTRVELDDAPVSGGGFVDMVLQAQHGAEIEIGVDMFRVAGDGLPECGNGFVELALMLQRDAEIGVGLRHVGTQRQRAPVDFDRGVELASFLENEAEIVMRLGGIGLELDRAPEHRLGLVEIAGLRRDGRQIGTGDIICRRDFENAAIKRRGLGDGAAAVRGERLLQKLIGRRRHGSGLSYGSRQLRYSTS